MKVRVTFEIELEEGFITGGEEEKLWFENEILIGDGSLLLHSNEIGDTIGTIKKATNLQYITEPALNPNK